MADEITVQTTVEGREFGLDINNRPVFKLIDGKQERGLTVDQTGRIPYASSPGAAQTGVGIVFGGDSFAARNNVAAATTSATAAIPVYNGVLSATTSAAHGYFPGKVIKLVGAQQSYAKHATLTVATVPSSTTFTCNVSWPSGLITPSAGSRSGMSFMADDVAGEGLFASMQRLTGGAFRLINNAGLPGHTPGEILAEFPTNVVPYLPQADALILQQGYNGVAQGDSASKILSDIEEQLKLTSGITTFVISLAPVAQTSGADSATKLQVALDVHNGLRALCARYAQVRFINIFDETVNGSTGYAQTKYLLAEAPGVHPSSALSNLTAKKIIAALGAGRLAPYRLVASPLDNVATSATNKNIARNGMVLTTSGGAAASGTVLASIPADEGAAITFTGALVAATSGTLTVAWAGTTGTYTISFSDGSAKSTTLTNGNTAVSWTGAVTATADAVVSSTVIPGMGANWTFGSTGGLAAGAIFVKPGTFGNRQCFRFTADANNDQARLSLLLTTSDFTPGGLVDVSFQASLLTSFNAEGFRTPALSNVSSLVAQLVFVIGGVETYTPLLHSAQSVRSAATFMDEDIVDGWFGRTNISVPSGAITTARLDLIAFFAGAGSAQMEMARVGIWKQ